MTAADAGDQLLAAWACLAMVACGSPPTSTTPLPADETFGKIA